MHAQMERRSTSHLWYCGMIIDKVALIDSPNNKYPEGKHEWMLNDTCDYHFNEFIRSKK